MLSVACHWLQAAIISDMKWFENKRATEAHTSMKTHLQTRDPGRCSEHPFTDKPAVATASRIYVQAGQGNRHNLPLC
jgi:hypothetical protein